MRRARRIAVDPFRFDALARLLSDTPSRRGALRLVVGTLVALTAAEETEANRKKAEAKRCPRKRRCGKDCCRASQICVGGRCQAKGACGDSPCFGQRCGAAEDFCLCTSSVEGVGFCLDGFAASCEAYESCTSSRQCPKGLCLATADCCGGMNLCVPLSNACPSGTKSVRPWS